MSQELIDDKDIENLIEFESMNILNANWHIQRLNHLFEDEKVLLENLDSNNLNKLIKKLKKE